MIAQELQRLVVERGETITEERRSPIGDDRREKGGDTNRLPKHRIAPDLDGKRHRNGSISGVHDSQLFDS